MQEVVTPLPSGSATTAREYVYGPDYVDEFAAQIDAAGTPSRDDR